MRDQLRPEKKKIQSSVCWGRGSGDYKKKKDTLRPEKKRYSRLSDGCAVLAITTGKKDTVFVLSMKGLSSTNWSPSPWFFFGLGVMNDAAESNCILSIGDDGCLNGGCSSSELIIIEINSESEFQQPANWNEVINQVKKLWHVV